MGRPNSKNGYRYQTRQQLSKDIDKTFKKDRHVRFYKHPGGFIYYHLSSFNGINMHFSAMLNEKNIPIFKRFFKDCMEKHDLDFCIKYVDVENGKKYKFTDKDDLDVTFKSGDIITFYTIGDDEYENVIDSSPYGFFLSSEWIENHPSSKDLNKYLVSKVEDERSGSLFLKPDLDSLKELINLLKNLLVREVQCIRRSMLYADKHRKFKTTKRNIRKIKDNRNLDFHPFCNKGIEQNKACMVKYVRNEFPNYINNILPKYLNLKEDERNIICKETEFLIDLETSYVHRPNYSKDKE